MWEFDQNFAVGLATQGDNRNGKGDFFTDLIALLLENSTGSPLYGRGAVPGLFFRKHLLDAFYPPRGQVELLIETKVLGAPKTGGNPLQKNPLGRPVSSDLKKRITEAGLKTIDLKAEWARMAGEGRGPSGDLMSWLRKSKPLCILFLAIRVVDKGDLQRAIELALAAEKIMDGVGVIAYEPETARNRYRPVPLPTSLELDRTLARVATMLRSLSGENESPGDSSVVGGGARG